MATTAEQSRAMALWMQTAPGDRKIDIYGKLATGTSEPWELLTAAERRQAIDAYRKVKRG